MRVEVIFPQDKYFWPVPFAVALKTSFYTVINGMASVPLTAAHWSEDMEHSDPSFLLCEAISAALCASTAVCCERLQNTSAVLHSRRSQLSGLDVTTLLKEDKYLFLLLFSVLFPSTWRYISIFIISGCWNISLGNWTARCRNMPYYKGLIWNSFPCLSCTKA